MQEGNLQTSFAAFIEERKELELTKLDEEKVRRHLQDMINIQERLTRDYHTALSRYILRDIFGKCDFVSRYR